MEITIRSLMETDLDVAADIAHLAFRNPSRTLSRAHLQRYLSLRPNCWLLAWLNGTPAGIAGLVDYGSFAYVGMVRCFPLSSVMGLGEPL
jgi:hypothetical protein